MFLDGKACDLYFDVRGKTPEEIIDSCLKIVLLLDDVGGLVEPLVVGPVGRLDPKVEAVFAREVIGITTFSFKEYCADLEEDRLFVRGMTERNPPIKKRKRKKR